MNMERQFTDVQRARFLVASYESALWDKQTVIAAVYSRALDSRYGVAVELVNVEEAFALRQLSEAPYMRALSGRIEVAPSKAELAALKKDADEAHGEFLRTMDALEEAALKVALAKDKHDAPAAAAPDPLNWADKSAQLKRERDARRAAYNADVRAESAEARKVELAG